MCKVLAFILSLLFFFFFSRNVTKKLTKLYKKGNMVLIKNFFEYLLQIILQTVPEPFGVLKFFERQLLVTCIYFKWRYYVKNVNVDTIDNLTLFVNAKYRKALFFLPYVRNWKWLFLRCVNLESETL